MPEVQGAPNTALFVSDEKADPAIPRIRRARGQRAVSPDRHELRSHNPRPLAVLTQVASGTMRNRRGALTSALAVGSILALGSCGFGDTGSAVEITPISAHLQGTARNTVAGYTPFRFEYGPTDAYGSVAYDSTYIPTAGGSQEVWEPVGGLTDETTYHYRLCVRDAGGAGTCGADATFTTPAGDYVQGDGLVTTIYLGPGYPQLYVGGTIHASSTPDGANAAGDGWVRPSTGVPVVSDVGTVTCLKVVGNRAAIGLSIPAQNVVPWHRDVVFIEDNGSTGDRWDASPNLSDPGTTCPTPTDADFDGFWFSMSGPATNYGSTLSSGDFVVHDHP